MKPCSLEANVLRAYNKQNEDEELGDVHLFETEDMDVHMDFLMNDVRLNQEIIRDEIQECILLFKLSPFSFLILKISIFTVIQISEEEEKEDIICVQLVAVNHH